MLALLGLILTSPILFIICLCIKIDSKGPIFFWQTRVGRFGKKFKIVKFRTMHLNDCNIKITVSNDPRITCVGKVLRRFKLDELPQLYNILIGDMRFVCPRPEVPEYVEFYPEDIKQIVLSVRGGLTDYASLEFIDEA